MTTQDNWINPSDVRNAVLHIAYAWHNLDYETYDNLTKEYARQIGCSESYIRDMFMDFDIIMSKAFSFIKMPNDYPEHFGYMPKE